MFHVGFYDDVLGVECSWCGCEGCKDCVECSWCGHECCVNCYAYLGEDKSLKVCPTCGCDN